LISNRSILILPKIPHFIEGAQQNARTGVGYASHRGVVIHKSYNPAKNITKQLRTSEKAENIGKQLRTSENT